MTGQFQHETSMTTSKQEHTSQRSLADKVDNPELNADSQHETVKSSGTWAQDFPKSMIKREQSLMRYIQPHILWNDKGAVTIKEVQIPWSNIADLIKEHLKDYKDFHLAGKMFEKLKDKLNVPTTLLISSFRPKSGSGNLLSPPGIPLK